MLCVFKSNQFSMCVFSFRAPLGTSHLRAKQAKLGTEGPVEFEVPDTFLSLLQGFSSCFQEHIPGEMVTPAGETEPCASTPGLLKTAQSTSKGRVPAL